MFEDKQNSNNTSTDDLGSSNLPKSFPNQQPSASPVDLPLSNQPPVKPKPGREVPGAEDMFADTEKAETIPQPVAEPTVMPEPPLAQSPQAQQEPQAVAAPPEPLSELPDDLEEEGGGSRKFFWIGLFALIVILGGGGWFAYSQFFKSELPVDLPNVNLGDLSPTNLNQEFEDQIVNLNLNKNTNQPEESLEPEINQNKNVNQATELDSDKDGLTDAEEDSYGTDPNEPDSDGDGYLDGNEVENGYDPKGPGRLLELNFDE